MSASTSASESASTSASTSASESANTSASQVLQPAPANLQVRPRHRAPQQVHLNQQVRPRQ